MNKYLLFEAIRQSNLHPTTKSFLAAVLKDIPGAMTPDQVEARVAELQQNPVGTPGITPGGYPDALDPYGVGAGGDGVISSGTTVPKTQPPKQPKPVSTGTKQVSFMTPDQVDARVAELKQNPPTSTRTGYPDDFDPYQ